MSTLKACSDLDTRHRWSPPRARCPAAKPRCRCPSATPCSARRCARRSPTALSRPSSGWAASGAPSASSGRRPASTRPRSATPAATRRTRPTRRCAARSTGHTEAVLVVFDPAQTSYDEILQAVLGEPRPDPGHAAGQRRRHPVPLGDLLPPTPQRERPSAAATPTRQLPAAAAATARSPPRSRRPAVLLRRGLPPAVPAPRTRAATAGSAAPGVSCPIGLGAATQA